MAPIQYVRPGDLITAEYMNRIVDAIEELRKSVGPGAPGAPTGVTISRFHPSASTRVGDELTIFGSGFGDANRNIVTIGSEAVTTFKQPGSGVDRLILTVPPIPGVGSGKVVTVTVGNTDGTAVAADALLVLPFQASVPDGDLRLTISGNPGLTLTSGTPVDYTFDLRLFSNMDESYTATATTTGTGWSAALVTPADGRLFIPRSDPPTGSTRQVVVRVTPGSAASGNLRLAVRSQRNVGFGNSVDLPMTLGTTGPAPQDQVALTFANSVGPGGRIGGDGVPEIANNTLVLVFFNIDIPGTGAAQDNYQVQVPVTFTRPDGSAATGWSTGTITPVSQFPLARNGHRQLTIEVRGDTQSGTPQEVRMRVRVGSTTRANAVGELTQTIRRF